ncbi:MAG: hypothetical protein HY717_24420 [Planctomycetes bacterium]|nr:hypothetical protein [Planctomycetota bacterium]
MTSQAVPGNLTASLHLACPRCGRFFMLPVARREAAAAAVEKPSFPCDQCGGTIQLASELPDPSNPVDRCVVCGNQEFFSQKDFNRLLGFWFVVVTALITFLVMLLTDHYWGLAVLLLVTMADWLIYRKVKQVSVCYLCYTIYRDFPPHPRHRPFYLGEEERFKKLRQAWIKTH